MKRILFAWELGAGMGHLLPHVALLKQLQQRGYEIHAVVKDLSKIVKAFGDIPCAYWQAPVRTRPVEHKYTPTFTFSHILHNVGMGDAEDLTARILAWKNIISSIKPDLIIADYAPTLLLAIRGIEIPCHGVNTGFFFPLDVKPMPVFGVFQKIPPMVYIIQQETVLVNGINQVLSQLKKPSITGVADIFQRLDHRWLMTIPELDHFGERLKEQYLGISEQNRYVFPGWPLQSKHKIFCYLKPFPVLEKLLDYLACQDASVVIVSDGLSEAILKKYTSIKMKFSLRPLDLELVSQEATLAITNATNTTAGYLLLRGIPQVSIPLTLEQQIFAQKILHNMWGITIDPKSTIMPDFLLSPIISKLHQPHLQRLMQYHQPVPASLYFDRVIQVISSV